MVSSIEVYRGAIQTRHCSSLYLPFLQWIRRGTYKIVFFFLDVMADDLDVNAATCRCSPTDRKTNKDQKLNEAKSDFCRSVVGTDSFSLSRGTMSSPTLSFCCLLAVMRTSYREKTDPSHPSLDRRKYIETEERRRNGNPCDSIRIGDAGRYSERRERRPRLSCSSFPSSSSSSSSYF